MVETTLASRPEDLRWMAHGAGVGLLEPTLLWVQSRLQALAVAVLADQGRELDEWQPIAVVGVAAQAKRMQLSLAKQPRIAAALRADGVQCFEADCEWPDPFDTVWVGPHAIPSAGHRCLTTRLPVAANVNLVLTVELPVHGRSLASLAEQLLDLRPTVLLVLRQHLQGRGDLSRPLPGLLPAPEPVAQSRAMRNLMDEIALVAGTSFPVLLQGETGVGKEVMAHRIHALSTRAHRALVQLNCAALPESLAEAELFGHVRGAFSGAQSDRAGYFQSAHQGSLFLDEVAELSLPLQAKLLRALQSGDIQRVGSDRIQQVDIRVIAASNVDLKTAVAQGRFRADLYHRLAVYPLHIPALRDRQDDIGPLAELVLQRLSVGMADQRLDLSKAALATLQRYAWPGNVRELEHVLTKASLRASREASRDGVIELQPRHLSDLVSPPALRDSPTLATPLASGAALPQDPVHSPASMRDTLRGAQIHAIEQALSQAGGRWSQAAQLLGLDASNLHKLAKRLGIKGMADSSLGCRPGAHSA